MNFEWDGRKAVANTHKHGVTFHEAATVFGDPLSMTFYDPDHSQRERRFITIGMSIKDRILMVAHADTSGGVRIISARKLTKNERKEYERNTK